MSRAVKTHAAADRLHKPVKRRARRTGLFSEKPEEEGEKRGNKRCKVFFRSTPPRAAPVGGPAGCGAPRPPPPRGPVRASPAAPGPRPFPAGGTGPRRGRQGPGRAGAGSARAGGAQRRLGCPAGTAHSPGPQPLSARRGSASHAAAVLRQLPPAQRNQPPPPLPRPHRCLFVHAGSRPGTCTVATAPSAGLETAAPALAFRSPSGAAPAPAWLPPLTESPSGRLGGAERSLRPGAARGGARGAARLGGRAVAVAGATAACRGDTGCFTEGTRVLHL